ncbi:hypothetical protein V8E55_003791 [Tylopilus felleus]
MSKRPPSQLPSDPQPPAKRPHITKEYDLANEDIHSSVKLLLLVQIPPDLLLVETLKTVFAYAPLKAGMKATPRFADLKALIEDNPDLKDALRDAISRGRYEDVMSLSILQKDV